MARRGAPRMKRGRRALAVDVSEAPASASSVELSSVGPNCPGPVELRPSIRGVVWDEILVALTQPDSDSTFARLECVCQRLERDDISAVAVASLVKDLVSQGWTYRVEARSAWFTPPRSSTEIGEQPQQVKARLRNWLRAARTIQLRDPAVRKFLRRLETPRPFGSKRISIRDLIDDGVQLRGVLSDIAALPTIERNQALARVIDPELVIVDSDSACVFTGLPLMEVWRYFRHTWSLEYRQTPGRTLFFMIRNRARPNAPVMAIGALANATLQSRTRDEWVGWTPAAVLRRLAKDPREWRKLRKSLASCINHALESIRVDDLNKLVGKVSGEPRERALRALAESAKRAREKHLTEVNETGGGAASQREMPTREDGSVDWVRASQTPLFVAKRAKTLADLLFAQRVLDAIPSTGPEALSALTADSGRRALAIALREVRKVGLASRLVELNVCGAVPPYGPLLSGKLAALAVASSELKYGYRARYKRQVSEIASRMAGQEIIRSPDICVATTTSLYGLASSQYNRLRATLASGSTLAWQDVGLTEGYGTAHLSQRTVDFLRRAAIAAEGRRNVNNVFGEGQSPRLRQVREALELLGIDSEGILRHGSPRRVYCIELFDGGRDALLFGTRSMSGNEPFSEIANAWRARWLNTRVGYTPALDEVARHSADSVSNDLAVSDDRQFNLFSKVVETETIAAENRSEKKIVSQISNPTLVQNLYQAYAACAEHHDSETIKLLHVETAVEPFLLERARRGGLILVTGNPGDGKTHLLLRLEDKLKEVDVDVRLDANQEDDAELIRLMASAARRSSGGLAVAINEGVLESILRRAGEEPWALAARDQLIRPFVYGENAPRIFAANVCVLDLNLRDNLSPTTVKAVIERLMAVSAPCEGCPRQTCSQQRNVKRMQPAVIDRVTELLKRVKESGFHSTMRDLHAFASYLLTGGDTCADAKVGRRVANYWEAAFAEGQGAIFEAVRRLDPADTPVPLLDDSLWRVSDRPDEWLVSSDDKETGKDDLEARLANFMSRKRRALFEHARGLEILDTATPVQNRYLTELVKPGATAVRRLVSLINKFYDPDEDAGDVLHLWTTHRFDAQQSRFAASFAQVPVSQLEILVPRLRDEIAKAFPSYRPNHLLLSLRGEAGRIQLRVDAPLLAALAASEQGMPSEFRRGEPEGRIGAFLDQLARLHPPPEDELVVRLVDIDTGENLRVGVDIANCTYIKV